MNETTDRQPNRDPGPEVRADDNMEDGVPILSERLTPPVKRRDLRTLVILGSFGLALVLLVALNMR